MNGLHKNIALALDTALSEKQNPQILKNMELNNVHLAQIEQKKQSEHLHTKNISNICDKPCLAFGNPNQLEYKQNGFIEYDRPIEFNKLVKVASLVYENNNPDSPADPAQLSPSISQMPSSRFKIVKLENGQPIKRGRWACQDLPNDDIHIPLNNLLECNNATNINNSLVNLSSIHKDLDHITSTSTEYLIDTTLNSDNKDIFKIIQNDDNFIDKSVKIANTAFIDNLSEQHNLGDGEDNIDGLLVKDTNSETLKSDNYIAIHSRTSKISSSVFFEPFKGSLKADLGFLSNRINKEKRLKQYIRSLCQRSDAESGIGDEMGDDPNLCNEANYGNDGEELSENDAANSATISRSDSTTDLVLNDQDESLNNPINALNNKIEQAMDLVKSHLLYAVHEEVELLKDQIRDLHNRKTVLEQENNILRTYATPETLLKLEHHQATDISQNIPNIL